MTPDPDITPNWARRENIVLLMPDGTRREHWVWKGCQYIGVPHRGPDGRSYTTQLADTGTRDQGRRVFA